MSSPGAGSDRSSAEGTASPKKGAEPLPTTRRQRREAALRAKRKKRALQSFGGVSALIALVVLAVGGWAWWQFASIDRVDVDLATVADGEPFNFLLVGSDTRELDVAGADAGVIWGSGDVPTGKRADTIVIARIDPKIASVELMSIPRDLWVASPGDTEASHRINATYAEGPQELIDVIQENLGIPINNYAEVDFNGFKGIVDGVGGVPLYFEYPVYDEQTGLDIDTAGCHVLDGVQALAFARSRELVYSNGINWVPDPTGDLGRITRQQIFMRRVLEKVSSLGLTDLNTLRVVAGVGANAVTLDSSMGTGDILALGKRFASFNPDGMKVHSLPSEPYRTDGGAAVVLLDEDKSGDLLATFTGEKPLVAPTTTAFSPELVQLDVMNSSPIAGLAATTSELLGDAGFRIAEVGNLPAVDETTILHGENGEQGARLLGESLEGGVRIEADSSLEEGQIQLVLAGEVSLAASPDTGDGEPGTTGGGTAAAEIDGSGDGGGETGDESTEVTAGVSLGDPPPGVTCDG